MKEFLLYIARSGLYLSLFYAFYLLVMRRTTFFRLNRALLLSGSYLCLLLPLIRLRTVTAGAYASTLTIVSIGTAPENAAAQAAFPLVELLQGIYFAGAAVTLALFLLSTHKMLRLIRKGEQVERDGCRLVLLDEEIPSFSWGRKVVMSRMDLEANPAIFTHERMHVQCRHSLDLLLIMPFQVLWWWNPLVWITREELRLLHEYQADEGVIRKGIDLTKYQLLLVRKAVGEQRFTLASGFQHAKLKNRIAMMFKPDSSGWMRWSYLALIPVLFVFMYGCNSPKNSKKAAEVAVEEEIVEGQDAIPFSDIDVKPTFNGGDANQFALWVAGQIQYPEQAKIDRVEGRVTLQFTIGSDGVARDATVVRGLREDLDAEALRVVSASPNWEPGRNAEGVAVPVTFTIPVLFKLQ